MFSCFHSCCARCFDSYTHNIIKVPSLLKVGGEFESEVTNAQALLDYNEKVSRLMTMYEGLATSWTDWMQLLNSIDDGTHTMTRSQLSALSVHISTLAAVISMCWQNMVDLKRKTALLVEEQ